jgi:hypothetical protein
MGMAPLNEGFPSTFRVKLARGGQLIAADTATKSETDNRTPELHAKDWSTAEAWMPRASCKSKTAATCAHRLAGGHSYLHTAGAAKPTDFRCCCRMAHNGFENISGNSLNITTKPRLMLMLLLLLHV